MYLTVKQACQLHEGAQHIRINDAMGKTLAAKDLRDKLEQQGVELAAPTSPEQFAALLNEDIVRWAQIVKSSGAAID